MAGIGGTDREREKEKGEVVEKEEEGGTGPEVRRWWYNVQTEVNLEGAPVCSCLTLLVLWFDILFF